MREASHVESERAIIGALLIAPELADQLFSHVQDEAIFTTEPARRIFTTMRGLYRAGEPITQMGIRREFERRGKEANLPAIFVSLMEAADPAPGLYFAAHIDSILDAYFSNRLREWAALARSREDAIRCAERIIQLAAGTTEESQARLSDVIPFLLRQQEDIEAGRKRQGYSWGIEALDEFCLIELGRLYTVAGLKGCGKTLFLLNMLAHNLMEGLPVLLFSVEMTRTQVAKRILTRRAEVNSTVFPSKYLGAERKERILQAAAFCETFPLTIDDTAQLGATELSARMRAWKVRDGIEAGLVGVDFLQLLDLERGRGESEATALKNVAYQLARTAKQLNLGVIATAQLRNEAEGQVPRLGYLEGSGGIAQASEAVLLLDLLSRRDRDLAKDEGDFKRFDVIVAKQRDGQSGVTVECLSDLRIGSFVARSRAEPSGPDWLFDERGEN